MRDHPGLWRLLVAAAFAGAATLAIAHGGGGGGGGGFSGGDSGDSSMNPFTGDSYAYFHCGHNLGEEGMIVPGRPNPQSPEEKARRAQNPPVRTGTCVPSQAGSGAIDRRDDGAVRNTPRG